MELMEAIARRKSIRAYQNKAVPKEKLDLVLEAARLAPTGGNRQEMKFIVVTDEGLRGRLGEATGGQKHVSGAPVVIAAVATQPDRMMVCDIPAAPVDLSIAVDHMTLAAFDAGLGTCWIGAFRQDMVKEILKVPAECRVVSLLTLGFPAEEGRPKTRKPIDQIVSYEKYS